MLFVAIAILFTISISFSFFVLFPLGIDLLLRIIESEPVPQEKSRSRGLLAARIVASLQRFRYRLIFAITKFVGKWLQEIFWEGKTSFLPYSVGSSSFLHFLGSFFFSPP